MTVSSRGRSNGAASTSRAIGGRGGPEPDSIPPRKILTKGPAADAVAAFAWSGDKDKKVGVGRAIDRRGAPIFASLAERHARIIVDVGVAEKINDEE
jgi:uncharacterized membrane protein